MDENNSVSSQSLNFNASKVRWLADTQLTPTDTLVLGSNENVVSHHTKPCLIRKKRGSCFQLVSIKEEGVCLACGQRRGQ